MREAEMPQPAARENSVTLVIHARVRGGQEAAFVGALETLAQAAAGCQGFVDQTAMPPNPPVQNHWTVLQWFATKRAALAWLHSDRRRALMQPVQPLLAAPEDVHIVKDQASGLAATPAMAIISTRVKPSAEADYRAWQNRIAAALMLAKGFHGYRFEAPAAGQDNRWVVVARFDSDGDLRAWMESPERAALIREAEPLTEELQARVLHSGFDQWFEPSGEAGKPPAWKMSMLVLLVLYPAVFLIDTFISAPLLLANGVPLWLAVFIGNVICVALLNSLVPWVGHRFHWWLAPRSERTALAGVGAVIGLYLLWLLVFALYSSV